MAVSLRFCCFCLFLPPSLSFRLNQVTATLLTTGSNTRCVIWSEVRSADRVQVCLHTATPFPNSLVQPSCIFLGLTAAVDYSFLRGWLSYLTALVFTLQMWYASQITSECGLSDLILSADMNTIQDISETCHGTITSGTFGRTLGRTWPLGACSVNAKACSTSTPG